MRATVTTPPATFWSPKVRNTSLIVVMIAWALLVAFLMIWIVSAFLVNGEWVCLDRKPIWGPPESPDVYTSCSGHIDELLRKWGWVS
jgi:hypothetical protein